MSALQPRRHPGSRDLCERKNTFEAVITTTTGKEHGYFVLFLMLQPLSHDIPGFLAPWQPCYGFVPCYKCRGWHPLKLLCIYSTLVQRGRVVEPYENSFKSTINDLEGENGYKTVLVMCLLC